MIENKVKISEAYIAESESKRIRVFSTAEHLYLSVKDLLLACGVKAPDKWIGRHRSDKWNISLWSYPTLTSGGCRTYPMYFADETTAEEIVIMLCKSEEVKRWLLNEVIQKNSETVTTDTTECSKHNIQDFNNKIDCMIASLIEMKNLIFTLK